MTCQGQSLQIHVHWKITDDLYRDIVSNDLYSVESPETCTGLVTNDLYNVESPMTCTGVELTVTCTG